jgi:hypothetical protein
MPNQEKSLNYGCGSVFTTTLFLIFLTLKLAEVGVVATWSWWWVFSPLWIPIAITAGLICLVVVVGILVALLK